MQLHNLDPRIPKPTCPRPRHDWPPLPVALCVLVISAAWGMCYVIGVTR